MLSPMIEQCPVRAVPRVILAGVGFFGNPFARANEWSDVTEIERLRERHERTLSALPGLGQLLVEPDVRYEVHLDGEDTPSTGSFEVFVGQHLRAGVDIPFELCMKQLPAALCAVFAVHGEDIESDWRGWITREWVPRSPYAAEGTYLIQRRRAGEIEIFRAAACSGWSQGVELLIPRRAEPPL